MEWGAKRPTCTYSSQRPRGVASSRSISQHKNAPLAGLVGHGSPQVSSKSWVSAAQAFSSQVSSGGVLGILSPQELSTRGLGQHGMLRSHAARANTLSIGPLSTVRTLVLELGWVLELLGQSHTHHLISFSHNSSHRLFSVTVWASFFPFGRGPVIVLVGVGRAISTWPNILLHQTLNLSLQPFHLAGVPSSHPFRPNFPEPSLPSWLSCSFAIAFRLFPPLHTDFPSFFDHILLHPLQRHAPGFRPFPPSIIGWGCFSNPYCPVQLTSSFQKPLSSSSAINLKKNKA